MWNSMILVAVVVTYLAAVGYGNAVARGMDDLGNTPAAQVTALTALYNSTGGRDGSWGSCSQGWATAAEPCTWFGVTCDGNGNVIGLTLADCGLAGSLPEALDGLVNLEFLVLNMNRLTGTLPNWSGMQKLLAVGLYNNSLTGTLPESWSVHRSMQSVSLAFNNLIGTLPTSWRVMTNMNSMSLSFNALSGTIPLEWWPFLNGSTTTLDVSHNALTGAVPDWVFPINNNYYYEPIGAFIASYNQLAGQLPSWNNVTAITTVALGHNNLEGTIPDNWRTFYGQPKLDLSFNRLTGTLGYWGQSAISTLLLDGNDLTGSIENITSSQFQLLNLSGNRFSGTIPAPGWSYDNCYDCNCVLDLSNNFITGTLPKSWCQFEVSMVLSDNCLTSKTVPCDSKDHEMCSLDLAHQRSTC